MQHVHRWLGVIALGLSIFLVTTDMTIVALALPSLAQHFHISDSAASAIVLSYSLPVTLLILPVGMVLHRIRPLTTFVLSVIEASGWVASSADLLRISGCSCWDASYKASPGA